jgi:hypothetical protein
LVAILIARRSVSSRNRPKPGTLSPGALLGGQAMRSAADAAGAHPYRAAGLAFLAGLAVGVSRDLQDLLKAALRTR